MTAPLPPESLVRKGRDLRVDLLRGIALWLIFIDHTPGNLLGWVTLRNLAFCDATEFFVLLAGYGAGLAYGGMAEREGWAIAGARVLGRVFTLYVSHIFLFVLLTAQVGFSAAALEQTTYLDELMLDPFANEPYRAMLEALLLRYQPAFLDILPMYIVMLALFAPALALVGRPGVLLLLSAALYVAARAFGLTLPSWTGSGWHFNPFAWQFLFVIGVVLARLPPELLGRRFPWRRWIAALVVLVLVGVGVALNLVWHAPALGFEPPALLADAFWRVDKTSLHPARLASALMIVWLLVHLVPYTARWVGGRGAAPFVLMGQQGLAVFCAGIFLSFLGRLALETSSGPVMQLGVNLAGLGALILVAAISAWYAQGGRRRKPASLPSATPPATA